MEAASDAGASGWPRRLQSKRGAWPIGPQHRPHTPPQRPKLVNVGQTRLENWPRSSGGFEGGARKSARCLQLPAQLWLARISLCPPQVVAPHPLHALVVLRNAPPKSNAPSRIRREGVGVEARALSLTDPRRDILERGGVATFAQTTARCACSSCAPPRGLAGGSVRTPFSRRVRVAWQCHSGRWGTSPGDRGRAGSPQRGITCSCGCGVAVRPSLQLRVQARPPR